MAVAAAAVVAAKYLFIVVVLEETFNMKNTKKKGIQTAPQNKYAVLNLALLSSLSLSLCVSALSGALLHVAAAE